jgi:hypothetical protein
VAHETGLFPTQEWFSRDPVVAAGAALATRNTADFDHCEIELINTWN